MRDIETVGVNRAELRNVSEAALSGGLGINIPQASQIVDQYEYAELSGKRTHGYVRVPWVLSQGLLGHEPISFKAENANPVEYVDCSRSIGYLAANEIIQHVNDGLHHRPVQVVVAKNIFPTNTLGYYLRNLVDDGNTIGVMFGTTPKLVAAPGTDNRTFGTNPLAMGFKHEGNNIISDITTASTSLGTLLVAKYWGGFKQDNFRTADGAVPQTIEDLYEENKFSGSIVQEIEHQSDRRLFSVAVVLQLLTSLIAGKENTRGNLTVVGINKEVFSADAIDDTFIDGLGAELLPGVRSHLTYQNAANNAAIQLPKKLWNEITTLSAK